MLMEPAEEPAMTSAEVKDRADDFARWRTRHHKFHRQYGGTPVPK